jgi:alkylated DNA repair dioxygenase AlkB
MTMNKPWPPPPDLESLKELFATADVEGLIADDCPIDEYDPEAKSFYESTMGWPTEKFTAMHILPLLVSLFEKQFHEEHTERTSALQGLAAQIEHFFGPEARPQVRSATGQ